MRRVRRRQVATHPHRRSEARVYWFDDTEANLLIEALGGPGYHLQPVSADSTRSLTDILHQACPDPSLDAVGFNEQAVELVRSAIAWDHHREADGHAVGTGGYAHPTVLDEVLRQLDGIWMRGELPAVLLPDLRRSALQGLEPSHIFANRVTDLVTLKGPCFEP